MLRSGPIQLAVASLLLTAAIALPASAGEPSTSSLPKSLEEATTLAAERNLPILLRMGKGWCTDCYGFDKAFAESPELRKTLEEDVVLCAIDITQGEGVKLSKVYSVPDYRVMQFILTDKNGEIMDRWSSFYNNESFIKHLTSAVENPITVAERKDRYTKNPTETDARKLGELRDYEGFYAEAVAYYRRAHAINPQSEVGYDNLILSAMVHGYGSQLFELGDLRTQGDLILASSKSTPKQLIDVAFLMSKVSKKAEDTAIFLPYLKTAIERTESVTDGEVLKMRSNLLPEYALLIQNDVKKAVEYKKKTFADAAAPKDWREDANMLNNLAWWCFENKINLDEADKLARRGVALAKPGQQKANILDTVAEICNLNGDCGDAVEYARLAVKEAPDNEYFQQQVVRFEKLLAERSK
jgi:tetratricopeptide (TPR) repeat protein